MPTATTSTGIIDQQEAATITGRVHIPFYNGGETQARIRQAKHSQIGRLQDIEQARIDATAATTAAWARLVSTRSLIVADRAQVEANRVALEGVRAEERAGQRTLLDLLNAEQEMLEAEVQLVTSKRDLAVASFSLLQSIGRLNAEALRLTDTVYDAEAHYEEVRRKWFGLSITGADGRRVEIDVADREREPVADE